MGFAAIGHLWSLAVEEQFYFLWPFFIFWVGSRRRLISLSYLLIFIRLGLAAFWQIHLPHSILSLGITYRMLPTVWDGFLVGGLLALWMRGKPSLRLTTLSGPIALTAVLIYAALLTLLHLHPGLIHGEDVFDYRCAFQAVIGIPLANLTALCFIFAVVQPGTWAYHMCNIPILRSVGRVSYGLYVFHLMAFVALAGLSQSLALHLHLDPYVIYIHAAVASAFTVVISYISFYYYERPFLSLKNRFTSIHMQQKQPTLTRPI